MKYFLLLFIIMNSYANFTFQSYEKKTYNNALYTCYTISNNDNTPVVAHVIQAPKKTSLLKIIPCKGQREEVSSIAKRTNRDAHIAINGSNYRRGGKYNGERLNVFIDTGTIINDYRWIRGALVINDTLNAYVIDAIQLINNPNPSLSFKWYHHTTPLTGDLSVLGGAGLLMKNGKVSDLLSLELTQGEPIKHYADEIAADFHNDQERDWFINKAHPRTAIGYNKDSIFFVVIDGRQEASAGLTLPDLAKFMQRLGCLDALNLGGGGCSTLVINNEVINKPSQGQERPVTEALIITSIQ